MRLPKVASTLLMVVVLGGCGAGASPTATPTSTALATPTATPASAIPTLPETPTCPVPDKGHCLGVLEAGTHTTAWFNPAMTYTVPSGWAIYEDLPGSVLLLPPGYTLSGVEGGTSDGISIGASTAPDAPDCSGKPATGVAPSASAIATWIAKHPGLATPKPQAITIGGLKGEVIDVRLAPGWTKKCPYFDQPLVPLIRGIGPSSFDHSTTPGGAARLYLLDNRGAVLSIQLDDVSDRGHLDGYSALVEGFQFAPKEPA